MHCLQLVHQAVATTPLSDCVILLSMYTPVAFALCSCCGLWAGLVT